MCESSQANAQANAQAAQPAPAPKPVYSASSASTIAALVKPSSVSALPPKALAGSAHSQPRPATAQPQPRLAQVGGGAVSTLGQLQAKAQQQASYGRGTMRPSTAPSGTIRGGSGTLAGKSLGGKGILPWEAMRRETASAKAQDLVTDDFSDLEG